MNLWSITTTNTKAPESAVLPNHIGCKIIELEI